MKNSLFFSVFLVSILFSACDSSCPPLTHSQKAAIETQILQHWKIAGDAVEKADADSYMATFSSDEFMAMHSEGRQFLSRKEYADSVKSWFSVRKSSELRQAKVKVTVLTENLAILDQKSLFRLNLKDNRTMDYNHVGSFIFKKEGSAWKIIHGHESWMPQ